MEAETERDTEDEFTVHLTRETSEALRTVAFHKRSSIKQLLAGAVQEMLEGVLHEGVAEAHAHGDQFAVTKLFDAMDKKTRDGWARKQLVRAVRTNRAKGRTTTRKER